MYKATIEIPDDTTLADIKKGVNNEDDDEKEITAENEYGGVINRDITEREK